MDSRALKALLKILASFFLTKNLKFPPVFTWAHEVNFRSSNKIDFFCDLSNFDDVTITDDVINYLPIRILSQKNLILVKSRKRSGGSVTRMFR